MTISAIVFDMDGLMLDTEPIYKRAWQHACQELGYEWDDESYAKVVGRPNPDGEAELLRNFGADFPLDTFRSRWPVLWRADANTGGIATKPGLLELVAFAESKKLKMAVATSSDAAYTEF